MKDIISKADEIKVVFNNQEVKIDNIKDKILELLNGAYSTPSYVSISNKDIVNAREKDLWIEIFFSSEKIFKGLTFNSILFQLKPKYNFLTFMRGNMGEYSGKCINYNLSTNTTSIYKDIMKTIEENL